MEIANNMVIGSQTNCMHGLGHKVGPRLALHLNNGSSSHTSETPSECNRGGAAVQDAFPIHRWEQGDQPAAHLQPRNRGSLTHSPASMERAGASGRAHTLPAHPSEPASGEALHLVEPPLLPCPLLARLSRSATGEVLLAGCSTCSWFQKAALQRIPGQYGPTTLCSTRKQARQ